MLLHVYWFLGFQLRARLIAKTAVADWQNAFGGVGFILCPFHRVSSLKMGKSQGSQSTWVCLFKLINRILPTPRNCWIKIMV